MTERFISRINPGNRLIDITSDDYLHTYDRELKKLKMIIGPLVREEQSKDAMQDAAKRWADDDGLAFAMTIHGLAAKTLNEEYAKRGIGLPGIEGMVVEGDLYIFVEDPNVPLGQALIEQEKQVTA